MILRSDLLHFYFLGKVYYQVDFEKLNGNLSFSTELNDFFVCVCVCKCVCVSSVCLYLCICVYINSVYV